MGTLRWAHVTATMADYGSFKVDVPVDPGGAKILHYGGWAEPYESDTETEVIPDEYPRCPVFVAAYTPLVDGNGDLVGATAVFRGGWNGFQARAHVWSITE